MLPVTIIKTIIKYTGFCSWEYLTCKNDTSQINTSD